MAIIIAIVVIITYGAGVVATIAIVVMGFGIIAMLLISGIAPPGVTGKSAGLALTGDAPVSGMGR